jgi:hypothetical protein
VFRLCALFVAGTWLMAATDQYVISTFGGRLPSGDGGSATAFPLNGPSSLAYDISRNLLVQDGATVFAVGTAGAIRTAARLNFSVSFGVSIASDSKGNLYVGSAGASCVYKVSPDGTVTRVPGVGVDCKASSLEMPVAMDAADNLYAADPLRKSS